MILQIRCYRDTFHINGFTITVTVPCRDRKALWCIASFDVFEFCKSPGNSICFHSNARRCGRSISSQLLHISQMVQCLRQYCLQWTHLGTPGQVCHLCSVMFAAVTNFPMSFAWGISTPKYSAASRHGTVVPRV